MKHVRLTEHARNRMKNKDFGMEFIELLDMHGDSIRAGHGAQSVYLSDQTRSAIDVELSLRIRDVRNELARLKRLRKNCKRGYAEQAPSIDGQRTIITVAHQIGTLPRS